MSPDLDGETLLRTALEAGRMHAFEWDLATGRVTRMGTDANELGDNAAVYLALVHRDDRAPMQAAIAALTPEQPKLVHEYRLLIGHRTRWMQDTAHGEFDADGRLLKLRGVAADITSRREAEARLALIAAVSDLIGASDDAAELLYEVSRTLGEQLHARRCLFTEIDLEHDRGIVRRDYCRGVSSVAGVYKASDYAELTLREMQAGRTVVNRDSKRDPRTAADYEKTYEPNGERAYVAVPLLRDGRWVAELWISDDIPRDWSEQDVALLESVAERAWTAIEKLRVNAALRESEARMQFVGERAVIGYWYWDIPNDDLFWSPVCARLHGIDEGERLTYDRYLETLHPDDRELVDRAVRSTLEGDAPADFDIECRVVLADGNVRWIHSKGSATFEGEVPVRMAGIALDITRRKTLELEREEASVAKDHFLALLSHELRTPMTTILGWASFLRGGVTDPATTQKGIEAIEQASRTQARLIDDLLDVSRIVSGKMWLDQKVLDAADVVRGAIQVIQPAARAASIALTSDFSDGPAFVLGDPMRLQQVIWNLLSNAVKFTPGGGEVNVAVLHDAGSVEIRVRDTGIGIEPEFLPHVFERFSQEEGGPKRRFGGLGLGLSIVRHLTELQGGSVHAESAGPGRGSTFSVRFPRALARPELAPARPFETAVDAHTLDGVNVLLVDDDPAAREVLGTILTGYGASVTLAASAAEALQRFEVAGPDVLVSDIGMPEQDGYALIAHLRRSASRVPAVAVTAYVDPRDRARALEAGFQAHLAKPVEPHELAKAVLRVLPPR
jgi:PAS domain S-box-containing protein